MDLRSAKNQVLVDAKEEVRARARERVREHHASVLRTVVPREW